MRQFYMIINADKREYIEKDPVSGSYFTGVNSFLRKSNAETILTYLMRSRWKGDRVYVLGDEAIAHCEQPVEYANWYSTLYELEREFRVPEGQTLYNYVLSLTNGIMNFTDIMDSIKKSEMSSGKSRYIYNHRQGRVVDLKHLPLEEAYYEPWKKSGGHIRRISPLPLLITIGDYEELSCGSGADYVGSWVDSSRQVELCKDAILGDPCREFCPDFSEHNPIIPWDKKKELMQKAEECGYPLYCASEL